jgi:hypothetical protein
MKFTLRGLDTQLQGIADEIRDVLDLGDLVVMGEDNRLALFLQLLYFIN